MTTWSIMTPWSRPLRSSARLPIGRLPGRPAQAPWQMPQPSRWGRDWGIANILCLSLKLLSVMRVLCRPHQHHPLHPCENVL
jgi:hypothetical protein